MKQTVGRARPEDILVTTDVGSYPSGHVANAATIAVALAIIFPRVWVWIVGAAYVMLMAFSRTYLHAHWLSDTIGGAALGAGVSLILAAAFAALWPASRGRAARMLSGAAARAGRARLELRARVPISAASRPWLGCAHDRPRARRRRRRGRARAAARRGGSRRSTAASSAGASRPRRRRGRRREGPRSRPRAAPASRPPTKPPDCTAANRQRTSCPRPRQRHVRARGSADAAAADAGNPRTETAAESEPEPNPGPHPGNPPNSEPGPLDAEEIERIISGLHVRGRHARPRRARQRRSRARGADPHSARHDEPPRARRGRDRHRQDADAAGARRAARGEGRAGVRGRHQGRPLGGRDAGRAEREAARADAGDRAGLEARGIRHGVLRARRHRQGRARCAPR